MHLLVAKLAEDCLALPPLLLDLHCELQVYGPPCEVQRSYLAGKSCNSRLMLLLVCKPSKQPKVAGHQQTCRRNLLTEADTRHKFCHDYAAGISSFLQNVSIVQPRDRWMTGLLAGLLT